MKSLTRKNSTKLLSNKYSTPEYPIAMLMRPSGSMIKKIWISRYSKSLTTIRIF